MRDAHSCRHCGKPLEPDERGRYVSCCSSSVPGPLRPVPEHGGGDIVRRTLDAGMDAATEYSLVTRPIARLLAFGGAALLAAVLAALCGGIFT